MFAYVTTHFVNHSLGLVSVQLMDRALERICAGWASGRGTALLYGSFSVHYRRRFGRCGGGRTLRMLAAEAVHLVLGLCISSRRSSMTSRPGSSSNAGINAST